MHEGNETFVDGLVNFEKMVFKYIFTISLLSFSLSLSQRMVASKVNDFSFYRKGSFPNDIRSLSNKNPELQRYIRYDNIKRIFNLAVSSLSSRELKVIDSQPVLMQMSHAIEANKRVRTTPTS